MNQHTPDANARLIAAAPEMFDLIAWVAEEGGVGEHEFIRPGGWLDRARAVVKKVEADT